MAHELVLRGGLQITPTPGSGTGDPQLTLDAATKVVGEVPAVDSTTFVTRTLSSGNILVGSNTNIATAVPVSGVITLSSGGVTTLQAGVVLNSNINAAAGIAYSKLNLTGSIVNADISAVAAIGRTKLANGTAYRLIVNDVAGVISELPAITASRVLVSDANGQPVAATTTTTEVNFVAGVTSSIQTQLGNRLSFSSALTPVNGDIIIYSGGVWTRLPIGTAGQVLNVSAGLPAWGSATANGLPVGGTANQYLNKIDGTNYNTQWSTLTLSKVTDITATFTEVNKLAGVTTSSAQFNFLNTATGPLQGQLDSKLGVALSTGSIWVGSGGTASPLSIGSAGQVLTVSGGTAAWQTITGTGTVTSVAVSGGTTGLTTSGGPITTSGTITLAGILIPINGGTGFSSYTIGDLLYADTTTTLAKRAAVASGSVLGSAGAATAPVYLTVDGGLTASATNLRLGGALINGTTLLTMGTSVSHFTVGAVAAGTPYWDLTNASATRSVVTTVAYGTTTASAASLTLDANGVSPTLTLSAATTSTVTLGLTPNGYTIAGNSGSFPGSQYAADYSGSYSTRSLPDFGSVKDLAYIFTNKTLGTGTKVLLGSDATGDVYYNGGSGTLTRLGVGTNGFVLTLAAGVPTWAAATGGFANPMTTLGDIILAAGGGSPARLAIGANTFVLTSNGTTAAWAAPSGSGAAPFTLNPQAGNYTFVLADGSTSAPVLVQATTATTQTLTIPLNASVPYAIGTQLNAIWDGTGTPVWAISGGGTLTPTAGAGIFTFPGVRSIVTAIKYATDSWYLLNAVPFATQTANTVFAGPTSGGATTPTFRNLVLTDLPFTGTPTNLLFARGDGAWAAPKVSDLIAATATNTIDHSNFLQEWQWATLAGGTGLKLSSVSTSAASNTQKLFEIALSGANSGSTQTTCAAYISNIHTGTAALNVGLYLEASGGTTNTALQTVGAVSVGAGSSPSAFLHVRAGTPTVPSVKISSSGAVTTSAFAGSLESANSGLYFTHTGGARLGLLGKTLDHASDSGTPASTTETDLYTDTLIGGFTSAIGDTILGDYALQAKTTGGATKRIRVYYAGTVIYDTTAVTVSADTDIAINAQITLDNVGGTTSVRCVVRATNNGSFGSSTKITKITGLTNLAAQTLKITGQSGAGAALNDITAITGLVYLVPKAQP